MVDCKFVTTPMELNFKKLYGSFVGPELPNPTEYCQLVGTLMFLVNSHPDICFAVNTLGHTLWKHKSVALSTVEAEYIVSSMACCKEDWLRKLFNELFEHVLDTTVIFCDKKSRIRLSENPVSHDRSKYIDIRYHFIRDMVQRGVVRLQHIRADEKVADILMNHHGKVNFLFFREILGVVERPSYEGPI
eukprot:PITA_26224